MKGDKWEDIKNFIEEVLETVKHELKSDSEESVRHYVIHDEYEMAFEGLFIELMQLKDKPKIDYSKCKKIAVMLKLNEESIFDNNFWENFKEFISDPAV